MDPHRSLNRSNRIPRPRLRSSPAEMGLNRRARASALLGLVAAVTLTSCQLLTSSHVSQGAAGKIAWPKDGDLWVYDLSSKQQNRIVTPPPGGAVTGATWSPTGKRLIYGQFWRRPNERSSGADLMMADGDGSNAHPFAERDAPNTVLETPEWMPSGNVYYTIRRVVNGKETTSIVRQKEGGEPETVQDNAYDPAAS